MGNCLITQFKSTIENSDLLRFNHIRVKFHKDVAVGKFIVVALTESCTVYTNGTAYNPSSSRLAAEGNVDTDRFADFPKPYISLINIYDTLGEGVYINMEDLIGCYNIYKIDFTTSNSTTVTRSLITGNIDYMNAELFPKLKHFDISNCFNVSGTFDTFTSISTLEHLLLPKTKISGNCDILVNNGNKTLPNLVELVLDKSNITGQVTPVTIKVSTIVTLANNGVKIYVNYSQIVFDTMTREQFDAMYESLPTVPVLY